jgi:16S rRNA (guanine527-N7)-methyltransferase
LSVSRETSAKLHFGALAEKALRYSELLETQGIERGLIGPSEANRIWSRHIENCLPIAPLFKEGSKVADIGSGAGLPGIVLALARPDLVITLIEPLKRRVEFLQEVVAELDLPITILNSKAEKVRNQYQHTTARAVAPLERLIASTLHLLKPGGSMIALKGERASEEIKALPPAITAKPITVELREVEFEGQLSRIVIVTRLK